jgi:tripartite-type tricarboxylate transporter receptor subunit TctC
MTPIAGRMPVIALPVMTMSAFRAGLVLLASLIWIPSAVADGAADFYKGKQLRILIGYGPGTGYDVYGRVLGRHIADHIPGAPTIVPQNMPGAASLTMVNHLYNVAARDGTVIAVPARNLFTEPLYGNDQARFDGREFSWIGSMSRDVAMCFSWHDSGINTIQDAMKGEVLAGATGQASGSYQFPQILNHVLGTKFKPVLGYPDSAAIGLAMERGEVKAYCSFTWGSIKSARPQWIEKKQINLLLQMTLRKHPELPDVPLVMDLAKDAEARQVFTLVFADQEMGRPVAGPPDIPADRLALLRQAFEATMKDPAFLADAKRTSVDIDPISGEAVAKIVNDLYATPKAIIDKVVMMRK